MKAGIFISVFWTSIFLCGGSACAQDSNRVPDLDRRVAGVDASAHVDVDGRPHQQAQDPAKPAPTYTRWVGSSSGPTTNSSFRAEQAGVTADKAAESVGGSPTVSSNPRPQIHQPASSSLPQVDGFPTPFRQNQFEMDSTAYSLTHPLSTATFSMQSHLAKTKRSTRPPQKSADSNHIGVTAGLSNNRQRSDRADLAIKVE